MAKLNGSMKELLSYELDVVAVWPRFLFVKELRGRDRAGRSSTERAACGGGVARGRSLAERLGMREGACADHELARCDASGGVHRERERGDGQSRGRHARIGRSEHDESHRE